MLRSLSLLAVLLLFVPAAQAQVAELPEFNPDVPHGFMALQFGVSQTFQDAEPLVLPVELTDVTTNSRCRYTLNKEDMELFGDTQAFSGVAWFPLSTRATAIAPFSWVDNEVETVPGVTAFNVAVKFYVGD